MKKFSKFLILSAFMAVLIMVGALGGQGTASANGGPKGTVYTSTNDANGNSILIFHRASDGTLTPAGEVATGGRGSGSGLGNQSAVVLSDNNKWLLAVNAGSNDISIFRVRKGELKLSDRVSSGGMLPISVAVHKHIAYVLNDGGTANISGFFITPRGKLVPIPHSTRPLSVDMPDAAQIQFSDNGRLLAVTEKGTSSISTYTVDRHGIASGPISNPSNGSNPFGFAFDPDRNRLYVSETAGGPGGTGAATSYEVDRNGMLSVIDGSESTLQNAACWLVVTRDGRYAYVTNAASGTVTGFKIARNGDLTTLEEDGISAGEAGRGPLDAALDSHSNFLYVLNSGTDMINGYKVQNDGSLVELDGPVAIPDGSNGLAAF